MTTLNVFTPNSRASTSEAKTDAVKAEQASPQLQLETSNVVTFSATDGTVRQRISNPHSQQLMDCKTESAKT